MPCMREVLNVKKVERLGRSQRLTDPKICSSLICAFLIIIRNHFSRTITGQFCVYLSASSYSVKVENVLSKLKSYINMR
jgi:hypothetical protein